MCYSRKRDSRLFSCHLMAMTRVWETANSSAQHLTATELAVARITEPGAVGECGLHGDRNNNMFILPFSTGSFTFFPSSLSCLFPSIPPSHLYHFFPTLLRTFSSHHSFFPSFPHKPCRCNCCVRKNPHSTFDCGSYSTHGQHTCQYFRDH